MSYLPHSDGALNTSSGLRHGTTSAGTPDENACITVTLGPPIIKDVGWSLVPQQHFSAPTVSMREHPLWLKGQHISEAFACDVKVPLGIREHILHVEYTGPFPSESQAEEQRPLLAAE